MAMLWLQGQSHGSALGPRVAAVAESGQRHVSGALRGVEVLWQEGVSQKLDE